MDNKEGDMIIYTFVEIFLLKTTIVKLLLALNEKSGGNQNHLDSFSGNKQSL